nr:DHCW motif cupin fold protein [Pseudomonas sp. UBA5706]
MPTRFNPCAAGRYSLGYFANHRFWRGHILVCLEGQLHTEMEDGRQFMLSPGMRYQVGNNAEGHRSFTSSGAKLFIVD